MTKEFKNITEEFMLDLNSSNDTMHLKMHDYLKYSSEGKTQKEIKRLLYLSKYQLYRLRKKIVQKLKEYEERNNIYLVNHNDI